MLVFGLDPGTATTGFGLIKVERGRNLEVVDWGLIETDKNGSAGKRLMSIYNEVRKLILVYKPDVLVIERIFFATNAKTAIAVGQAQGVMLYAAARSKVEVVEYAPATIKKVVTGSGRADKKIIQQSLRKVFGAKVRSKINKKTHFDNAADALAIALCHAMTIRPPARRASGPEGGDKDEL